jgi:hypothetical protein
MVILILILTLALFLPAVLPLLVALGGVCARHPERAGAEHERTALCGGRERTRGLDGRDGPETVSPRASRRLAQHSSAPFGPKVGPFARSPRELRNYSRRGGRTPMRRITGPFGVKRMPAALPSAVVTPRKPKHISFVVCSPTRTSLGGWLGLFGFLSLLS